MAAAFTFETVAGGVSEEVSLALDKTGNPSVVFSQGGSGQIVVARRNAGTWTQEVVQSAFTGMDSRPRIAIDSLGNPQIAYRDLTGGDLIHAVNRGGQWSFTHIPTRLTPDHRPGGVSTIDFALHPGRLDTESRDVAYFVYVDPATDGIGFAHTGNLGPTPVTVQDDPNDLMVFGGPSAAFDPSEGYFVAYVGLFETGGPQDDISIRATNVVDIESGTFSPPAVIEGSPFINVRRPTSIVRTFSGGCLAYFDIASKTLKAHVMSIGFARLEAVATNINNIVTPSAAAQGDEFRVAYADSDGVKLASRSRTGTWTVETVDAVSAGSPSLAYDNAGRTSIAYVAGGELKYAARAD